MEPLKSDTNIKFNYAIDKYKWVKHKNGSKIKLRKYISNITLEIVKINKHGYNINREFIIKAYNEGGLNGVKLWIENEFKLNKEKNENKH